MTELGQVIHKLSTLESNHIELAKGQNEIMTAIIGNDRLGQKGFVHRIKEVEKMSWENKNDLKDIKTVKAISEKKIALLISLATVLASVSIELVKAFVK